MSRSVSHIIEARGGWRHVAAAAGVKHWAVRKWPRNGIPEPHWPIFTDTGIATAEELYAANRQARDGARDGAEGGKVLTHASP